VHHVLEPGHVLQPDPDRHPHLLVPDQLGDEHALVEPPRGQDRERQHRNEEAGGHPADEGRRPPGPRQGQGQDHQHREDRPRLDRPGEPEHHAAPDQAPAAGQPVAVEHREGGGQAEQRDPGLQEDCAAVTHAGRVDREHPAGHDHGDQPAMAHQQAAQHHASRAGQQGQDPRDGHAPGRPDRLGQQRGRGHQQRDARRLREEEIAVRQGTIGQAQSAGEINPVVVPGDAEQHAWLDDLIYPQPQGQDRGGRDDQGHRRAWQQALTSPRPGQVLRPGRVLRPGSRRCRLRGHRWQTSAGLGPDPARDRGCDQSSMTTGHTQVRRNPTRTSETT
jgi:hypothetical protein